MQVPSTMHPPTSKRAPGDSYLVPADPIIFPAYVRATEAVTNHFINPPKIMHCLPVRGAVKELFPVVVVIQSLMAKGKIVVDSKSIIHSTILLSGVSPYSSPKGAPVAHYRSSLHDLAVRFHDPFGKLKVRWIVRATGSYRTSGAARDACFTSVPLPTCDVSRATTRG